MADAIEAAFPKTTVQTCIVHLIRSSLNYASWKDRKRIVDSWERALPHVTPFFAVPPAVRRVIYTTNAIESLNMQLRKIIKTRGHFPNDEAACLLLWLALQNVMAKRTGSPHNWREATNQFAILHGERFTQCSA